MRQSLRHQAIIVIIAGLVLFTNLGGPRLWDRDEPRNAGCAAEMFQRGDWVVPVFNAELRAHKPVLLYWLIMSAYTVFGVNEFSARFWSAVLAMGTALATYHIGRRFFNARVGLWAGIILATSLMFDVAGRAATPDSVLIFFSTLALTVYVLAAIRPESTHFPASWTVIALMYAIMGMAVLAKGPAGVVLPTAVIGMYLLIVRLPASSDATTHDRWCDRVLRLLRPFAPMHFLRTCWFMRPLTAIAIVSAVALPWYIWVGFRTEGEFLREFFLEHNVGRASRAMEGHSGSLLFYPVAILIGFFPWSVFAGPTLIGVVSRIRRHDPWYPGYVFASCWISVYVGLFSLAQTKLPSYVTPCYPALALLTACFMYHWTRGEAVASRLWPRLSFASLALVGVGMIIALPLVASRYFPGEGWLGMAGLIPLIGAVLGLVFFETDRVRSAGIAFGVMSVALTTFLFGFAINRVDRHQQNDVLLAAIEQNSPNPHVGAFGCLEPTWVYYGGRPIDELTLSASNRTSTDRGEWKPKPRPSAADFFCNGEDRFIITTDHHWEQLRPTLPTEAIVLAECPLFLKDDRLLLIGARSPAPQTADRDRTIRK